MPLNSEAFLGSIAARNVEIIIVLIMYESKDLAIAYH